MMPNVVVILQIFISTAYCQTFIIAPAQIFPLHISGRSWPIFRESQYFEDEVVTKKPEEVIPPPEIRSLHCESRIKYRYAQTLVTSRVANPANKSQEVKFTVVLPETAFISGFKMEIKGKVYKAYVKEKEEASKIYQDALDSGAAAALVGLSARDSNQFTVSVNVEPNSRVTFNLTYEELLSRILGFYTHAINLNPGQLVRDLVVDVFIHEPQQISKLHVPELHSGNEVDPQKDEKVNPIAKIDRISKYKAHVRYAPTLEQQRAKSKEKDEESLGGQLRVQYDVEQANDGGKILVNDGYFVHFFAPSDLPPLRKLAIFVLDVSGSMEGRKLEQLKEAMNTILDDLPSTDYFNIIEFSYSVTVWNLDTLSASAVFQPESPADGLWWFTKSNSGSPVTTTTPSTTTPLPDDFAVPAYPATPEYRRKAKEVINKMRAGGGTNIHGALKTALLVSKLGFKNLVANNSRTGKLEMETETAPATSKQDPTTTIEPSPQTTMPNTVITTTLSSTTSAVTEASTTVAETMSTTEITTTTERSAVKNNGSDGGSGHKNSRNMAPEPIIIFLTDGDATVGYTKPSKILSMVKELNQPKCAVFSLAFGEGADFSFLRRLSLANSGFARNIYEAADAALQLNSFYRQVASPLLSNITFSYVSGQVDNSSVTLKNFHTLFLGSELVVAGKIGKSKHVEAKINALTAKGPMEYNVQFVRDTPDVFNDTEDVYSTESNEDGLKSSGEDVSEERDGLKSQPKKKKKGSKTPTLERLWAYLTIKQLLDRKHVLDSDTGYLSEPVRPDKEIIDVKKKALKLALRYSFVTALTSLVVVKPNSTADTMDAEKLKSQPTKNFSPFFGARPLPLGLDSNGYDSNKQAPMAPLQFVHKTTIMNKMDVVDENVSSPDRLQYLPVERVAWLNNVIDTDNETVTLPLGVNGTNQQYRIGLNEPNVEFQECFNSPASTTHGSSSHCRHIVHCIMPEIVPSATDYIRFFCPLPGGYAGVCCSDVENVTAEANQTMVVDTTTENSEYTTVNATENTTDTVTTTVPL